jgi:hypothetical protein
MEKEALTHSSACRALLDADRLGDALAYCTIHGVEPPQCSLTASSPNADRLRAIAKNMLVDETWWLKRLKIGAARKTEMIRIRKGLANLKND